ncbi:placenta-specific gene 8 protein-like [Mugil cephalus]|uniref:placenta-specific gene 8 protein-like n=1 Tax=Mugil cephalus TaxID=48193 RepID=UPI001FB8130B|nr:placenta-specific gene 8 protein-like [Mugil cephalus]
MAVFNQPTKHELSDFQSGLCNCCDDVGTCVYGYFCYMCLGCSIASEMGECFCCGHSVAIRSIYRTRYNIRGSLCEDFMVSTCCSPCASCQLKRDIDRRKEQGIF